MFNGHGDDIYRYSGIRLNFSSNVYAGFYHEGLFTYLADKLDDVRSYPEPRPTSRERDLTIRLGLKEGEVMLTNGATEAIYLIAQTYAKHKSVILQPTFSEYADACRLHGHEVRMAYHLNAIPLDADLVWICNPNNPTGQVFDHDELLALIESRPDTLFVIDQSYEDYTEHQLLSVSEACGLSRVLLLHSLTKRFAVPGLRIGYVTGNAALLEELRLRSLPWSFPSMSCAAVDYFLKHDMDEEFSFNLHALLKERQRVHDALMAMGGIEVWPSETHFMLCRLRMGLASALKEYLAIQHGMLIRDASNFHGLDKSYFRIAVHSKSADDQLIDALRQWMAQ